MNGSPFFLQRRPGKNQQAFSIIKFKTMLPPVDRNGRHLSSKERITPFGMRLRKLSLDEIPQLFNVLKGDMSIVGPRPLLFDYIPLYNEEQLRRHEVKPGITGWAQVNGRNRISWEEKFKRDVYYVDHLSFMLDLQIVGLTVQKVIKREGINQDEETTMQAFMGTNK